MTGSRPNPTGTRPLPFTRSICSRKFPSATRCCGKQARGCNSTSRESAGDRPELVARSCVPGRCRFAPGFVGRSRPPSGTRHSTWTRAGCWSSPHAGGSFVAQGEADRAIQILESYLRENPADTNTQIQLNSLRPPPAVPAISPSSATAALSLFSNWRPPEVDEKVPPVESGVPCEVNEVVQNAGKRVQEFIRNVDHFTATESLFHESMNAWGFPDPPQTRKFDYVVSIQEVRPGILTAYEYRDGDLSYQRFPSGVATLGLPALVLIFHPYSAANYSMECEGLAHWNGGLAWQAFPPAAR
jgi:hypothetical protein